MNTFLGFIVAAWLTLPGEAPLPFATLEACEAARERTFESHLERFHKHIYCLETGAVDPELAGIDTE